MRRGVLTLALLLVVFGSPAAAEWGLTYGLQYVSTSQTGVGGNYYSQFLPTLTLRTRGLLTPLVGIYADLMASGWGFYGDGTSLNVRTYSLNFYGTKPTYSLLVGAERQIFDSVTAGSRFVSTNDAFNITTGLRPWRNVFVSLQYASYGLENLNDGSSVSTYTTSTLLGAYIDLKPFALTYTQTQSRNTSNIAGAALSTSDASTIGLTFDKALVSGLGLQFNANISRSRVEDSGGIQDTTFQNMLVRLSATPLRGLVAEGWLLWSQQLSPAPVLGLGFRSEPIRGLLLDGSAETGEGWRTWRGTLRASPLPRLLLWANLDGSEQSISGLRLYEQRESGTILLHLSGRADLSLDYLGVQSVSASSFGSDEWLLSYLHRISPRLSYRLGYRIRHELRDQQETNERSLWADSSWLLSSRASLSLGLRSDLLAGGETSVASAWLRWSLDARTDLLLSYTQQSDADTWSPNGSITIVRRLSTGATVQLSYYTNAGDGWARQSFVFVFTQGTSISGGP